jgi:hypothetical protein
MANAIAGTVPPHLTSMRAGTRHMVRLGVVRSRDCCYPRKRWDMLMCAALSGSGTKDVVVGDVVSKPRRFPR